MLSIEWGNSKPGRFSKPGQLLRCGVGGGALGEMLVVCARRKGEAPIGEDGTLEAFA